MHHQSLESKDISLEMTSGGGPGFYVQLSLVRELYNTTLSLWLTFPMIERADKETDLC